jgi:hypothetical protein
MKRAAGRAYQRLKGAHPRRPKSQTSKLAEIGCDLLLGMAAFGTLGGLILLVWATMTGLRPERLAAGAALIGLGALLLILWERIAWEPFVRELGQSLDGLS